MMYRPSEASTALEEAEEFINEGDASTGGGRRYRAKGDFIREHYFSVRTDLKPGRTHAIFQPCGRARSQPLSTVSILAIAENGPM